MNPRYAQSPNLFKMKYSIFICFFTLFSAVLNSQVGINTESPLPATSLQIDGSDSGVLINRVSLDGTNDDTLGSTTLDSSYEGLMVYNTNSTSDVQPGFYFWDGLEWAKITSSKSSSDYTGWGDYADTQFTSAAPGNVAANTLYFMPNNAGNTVDSQKPIDINTFYDTANQTITGRNGDGLNVTIEFKLRPTTNNDTRVTLGIDIGGTVGEIYTRDFVLTRGQNQEHYYLSSFNAYTLGTWEANGGRVLIRSTHAVQVYDIRYVLTRTHKAR